MDRLTRTNFELSEAEADLLIESIKVQEGLIASLSDDPRMTHLAHLHAANQYKEMQLERLRQRLKHFLKERNA